VALLALLSPWRGEGGGGDEEACGIAGGGEEDVDQGREVHGGVDKDQCRREEAPASPPGWSESRSGSLAPLNPGVPGGTRPFEPYSHC
jgi:hypothetical protein